MSRIAIAGAIAIVVAISIGAGTGGAASSTTVVGATVPSATSIDASGCAAGVAGRTDLGVVLPGSLAASTSDCTVTYGSSNDTAMLRMYQRDGAGRAMWRVGEALDPSFDADGWRRHDVEPGQTDKLHDAVPLPDGTILATGTRKVGGTNDQLLLVRYLPNGALDPTFGTGGIAAAPDLGLLGESGSAIVRQPDGKIVVGGQLNANYAILRYTSSGALDTTFNGTGYTTYDPGSFDGIVDIDIDSQGRIVAAGATLGGASAIVRLTASGTLDTSFAGDGVHELADSTFACTTLDVDSSDRPLCAGSAGSPAAPTVRRDTVSGVPDATFGTGGNVTLTAFPGVNALYKFAFEHPGGGYVLGGYSYSGLAFTQRVSFAGVPQPSWDGDGLRTYTSPWANFGLVNATLVGTDTIVGLAQIADPLPSLNYDAGVVLLSMQDGAVQSWYGGGTGGVSLDVTANTDANLMDSVAVGADGRVVLSGYIGSTTEDSLIAQLAPITIPDFASGVADWDSGSSSVFGACLRTQATGSPAAPWSLDPGADCQQTDSDAWQPIAPTAASADAKLAGRAVTGGADATVGIRFGFRASTTQTPGAFVAPITFEAVAPNA